MDPERRIYMFIIIYLKRGWSKEKILNKLEINSDYYEYLIKTQVPFRTPEQKKRDTKFENFIFGLNHHQFKTTMNHYKSDIDKFQYYFNNFLNMKYQVLDGKVFQFFYIRTGRENKHKSRHDPTFTFLDILMKFGENPICYLTGEPINIYNASDYSIDHKIPLAQKGPYTLENAGLTKLQVNLCKNALNPEEFIELCWKVAQYNA